MLPLSRMIVRHDPYPSGFAVRRNNRNKRRGESKVRQTSLHDLDYVVAIDMCQQENAPRRSSEGHGGTAVAVLPFKALTKLLQRESKGLPKSSAIPITPAGCAAENKALYPAVVVGDCSPFYAAGLTGVRPNAAPGSSDRRYRHWTFRPDWPPGRSRSRWGSFASSTQ
jgi:hypothetical protein